MYHMENGFRFLLSACWPCRTSTAQFPTHIAPNESRASDRSHRRKPEQHTAVAGPCKTWRIAGQV